MMMPAAALFGMIMRMFVCMLAIAFFMFVMVFMAMLVSTLAVFRMGMVMFTVFVPAFAHLGVNVLMTVMVVILFRPTAIVCIAVLRFGIGRITVEPNKFGTQIHQVGNGTPRLLNGGGLQQLTQVVKQHNRGAFRPLSEYECTECRKGHQKVFVKNTPLTDGLQQGLDNFQSRSKPRTDKKH